MTSDVRVYVTQVVTFEKHMPKKATELSDLQVRRITEPGFHAVGGVAGLYLRVEPSGHRGWILYTMMGDRRRKMGLGPYSEVSLAHARDAAREKKNQIRSGLDPIEERRAENRKRRREDRRRMTFQEATEAFLEGKVAEWRNVKHQKQWRTTLRTYAYPVLGHRSVNDITIEHVIEALKPIWISKTETATRVRQRIHSVFDWAIVTERRDKENPAIWKGRLDKVFPAPTKIKDVEHHRALPYHDVPGFTRELHKRGGQSHMAILFCLLTGTRSGETRSARWREIDFEKRLWTIPKERTKAGRAHTVPLADQAIELLRSLGHHCEIVIPSPRNRALSDSTLSKAMRTMGVDAVPHGLRATFRTWGAETTNHENIVLEMALGHTIDNKVEAAYRRGELLGKRTRLMQDWADFCYGVQS